jgi:hypothetical protein
MRLALIRLMTGFTFDNRILLSFQMFFLKIFSGIDIMNRICTPLAFIISIVLIERVLFLGMCRISGE